MGGKWTLTLGLAGSDLAEMVQCSFYRSPTPDEVVIHDDEAEQAARRLLEEDAEGFRCSLSNARVSRLGDMKIVRMDLSRGETGEKVGLAMSIEQAGRISLGIYID